MNSIDRFAIGVAGAGAMGRGIAQLFAQSGHRVVLYDTVQRSVESALSSLQQTFGKLVERGKIDAATAQQATDRVTGADSLAGFVACDLVIEAIVERLDAKRTLFAELERIVRPDAILATNTSSLSVTAIANACERPGRVAGYHFFNPVPLMRVVEIVRGVRTEDAIVDALLALTLRTGHRPVVAQDTPGFLINHAGRGYGTESLRLVSEGVADVPTVDQILREQVVFDGAGFRLGPFELLDLTGLDVSQPVMESIYRQFYEEPRFRPSVIGAQRLAGGLFGRKVGQGFYRYVDGQPIVAAEPASDAAAGAAPSDGAFGAVWVQPGPRRDALAALVEALGARLDRSDAPAADSLVLVAPLGTDASTCAAEAQLPAERVIAIDTLFPFGHRGCKRRVLMRTAATRGDVAAAAARLFAADGARVSLLRDSTGFVAQRVVAMIVAIACEIAQQRIASPEDVDAAVRIGLGYPVGPLSMGDSLGPPVIVEILRNIERITGDPRYRPSLWLRRRALLGLSLKHED
ncbi:MAG TPA: 3-hydroxyacyl-CoA dehydrogenase [Burkholderiaceae bacterium]|nr:3-hydroxyacyl-CoA dehydrogenase [Burkholderiaceae bacterium]